MKTKLKDIIDICIKDGAPFNSCEGCHCSEKECLTNLLDEYNELCDESEVIAYIE